LRIGLSDGTTGRVGTLTFTFTGSEAIRCELMRKITRMETIETTVNPRIRMTARRVKRR
jgi:hypothetical protein